MLKLRVRSGDWGGFKMNDINSLSHTRWNCQYHIAYAPKQRRKVFYKEKGAGAGKILREVCEWKKKKITEEEACQDNAHMLLEIPPEYSVLSFMGLIEKRSILTLYERFQEQNYKYRNREFWRRGYYIDTA